MNDRELLELAAKAAGIELHHWNDLMGFIRVDHRDDAGPVWHPLESDSDALQLLAHLRLSLDYRPGFVGVHKGYGAYIGQCPHDEENPTNSAATRRAIVRAAAELGEAAIRGKGAP